MYTIHIRTLHVQLGPSQFEFSKYNAIHSPHVFFRLKRCHHFFFSGKTQRNFPRESFLKWVHKTSQHPGIGAKMSLSLPTPPGTNQPPGWVLNTNRGRTQRSSSGKGFVACCHQMSGALRVELSEKSQVSPERLKRESFNIPNKNPGKLTAGTPQQWRFGRWVSGFQLGDF